MDMIKDRLQNRWVTAGIGVVLGLILGLIIGWGIWPPTYIDAAPDNLRTDLQDDYLRMSVQTYSLTRDVAAAQQRWDELGEAAEPALDRLRASGTVNPSDIDAFVAAVGAPAAQPGQATAAPGEPTAAAGGETEAGGGRSSLLPLLALLCVLLLVIGGALAYFLLGRKGLPGKASGSTETGVRYERTDFASQGQEAPVAQFMTTYSSGDDLYDDSFSIDSPSGEFLGECGVGISDTIGVGDPKKVTAFEVWLFDKNDIQTVTKVLMSAHAFDDPTIRQRLESKGEPMLAEPGKRVLLETATLMLEARVVDMNYGQGALPANSFFDRVTLELAIWPKETAEPA